MIDETQLPEGAFIGVLVRKFSRFTRKRERAGAYKSMLLRQSIRVVSITEPVDNTPTGSLAEGFVETVAEFVRKTWRRISGRECDRRAPGSSAGRHTATTW